MAATLPYDSPVKELLFCVVLVAVVLNSATVVLSIVRPDVRVWPPPRRDSWQYRYDGLMSFTGLLGVVALGVIDWNSFIFHHWARFPVGGSLMACGLFAFWGYLTLGVHASRGLGGDLVTTGPYRYSRNPQYVGAIPALLGYAVICNSILALVTALLVSGWFVLLPFAEEPWCRDNLGEPYEEYLVKVPRFLGLRRLRELRSTAADRMVQR
jgi:protein-S-isoprenylcysteine O-methyltransferase Ste14